MRVHSYRQIMNEEVDRRCGKSMFVIHYMTAYLCALKKAFGGEIVLSV